MPEYLSDLLYNAILRRLVLMAQRNQHVQASLAKLTRRWMDSSEDNYVQEEAGGWIDPGVRYQARASDGFSPDGNKQTKSR